MVNGKDRRLVGYIGLSKEILDLLYTIFNKYPDISKVVLFGSRAKGTAKHNSDIDLAIYGIDDDLLIEMIAMELEELPLPYKFDVKAFNSIKNLALSKHIERIGINVFKSDRYKLF